MGWNDQVTSYAMPPKPLDLAAWLKARRGGLAADAGRPSAAQPCWNLHCATSSRRSRAGARRGQRESREGGGRQGLLAVVPKSG